MNRTPANLDPADPAAYEKYLDSYNPRRSLDQRRGRPRRAARLRRSKDTRKKPPVFMRLTTAGPRYSCTTKKIA